MLTILGRASSINVRKVLWTATELGLTFDNTQWGDGDMALNAADFLALNPNAMVPVLRDGERILWESNTICRYLAARYGDGSLLPLDPGERAEVEKWMDWQATELNNSWRYAFMSLVRRGPEHNDPRQLVASIKNWNRHMQILNLALSASGGPYILGERFTLADVVLGLSTHRWYATNIIKPEVPQVERYYEALSQRPAFMQWGRNGFP